MKNVTVAESIIAVLVGVCVTLGIYVILTSAENRDMERMLIMDCVQEESTKDNFPGTLRQAWDTYYQKCSESTK